MVGFITQFCANLMSIAVYSPCFAIVYYFCYIVVINFFSFQTPYFLIKPIYFKIFFNFSSSNRNIDQSSQDYNLVSYIICEQPIIQKLFTGNFAYPQSFCQKPDERKLSPIGSLSELGFEQRVLVSQFLTLFVNNRLFRTFSRQFCLSVEFLPET